jgi:hypothetical protein
MKLTIGRIVWSVMTFSMVFYGILVIGRATGISIPSGSYSPLEALSLAVNGFAIYAFVYSRTKLAKKSGFEAKFRGYIVCWAINEMIVITSILAVFTGSGNAFFYVVNLLIALTGNLLTFPKKD